MLLGGEVMPSHAYLLTNLPFIPSDKTVIADARRIAGEPTDSSYVPLDPRDFASRVFHTSYMGTENSSSETRQRAADLSTAIGSYHIGLDMSNVVASIISLFSRVTGKTPEFTGSDAENLALQNIQVGAYAFAPCWISR
jgi:NAD+ synthase (glutamine-hydrolysing)